MKDDLLGDMKETLSWLYCSSLFRMLHKEWKNGKEICETVAVKTLIVAAGRQDIVVNIRETGKCLRSSNPRSRAAVLRGARHAWTLQLGKIDLLASGIKDWIEDEDLPREYEVLNWTKSTWPSSGSRGAHIS